MQTGIIVVICDGRVNYISTMNDIGRKMNYPKINPLFLKNSYILI